VRYNNEIVESTHISLNDILVLIIFFLYWIL